MMNGQNCRKVDELTGDDKIPDAIYIGLQKTGSLFVRKYFQLHSELSYTRCGKFFQRDESDPEIHGREAVHIRYADYFLSAPNAPCLIDMYESLGMGYRLAGIADWSADIGRASCGERECQSVEIAGV